MNEVTMYSLKPLITSNLATKIDDNRMYKMKNIQETCRIDEHSSSLNENVNEISEQNPLPEVALLEARQEKILAQLAEFKEQILGLCDILKSKIDGETITNTTTNRDPIIIDLIINANPRKPCWTIRALQNLWKNVNFSVKSYKHSSAKGTLPEFVVDSKMEFHDTVNVDLIWKEVDDTEFIVSGYRGYPLIGETNFLRYLVRKLSNENYEKSSNVDEVTSLDSILDMSHRLHYEESSKNVQIMLCEVGRKLGKKLWLSRDETSGIADVAVWSAIKQASPTKLPSNLKSWFERCENTFLK